MVFRVGPYDALYKASPSYLLWGTTPSHVVRGLSERMHAGTVLDIGCGDGVNALFLEQAGFVVRGVDISELALEGLRNRFNLSGLQRRGTYTRADIHEWDPGSERVDALVSLGLFQCLRPSSRVRVHARLHEQLVDGGVVLFSCLTNTLPLPENHLTTGIELVDISEVQDLFSGLSIEYTREAILQDQHGDLVGRHQHSVVWVVARKTTQGAFI